MSAPETAPVDNASPGRAPSDTVPPDHVPSDGAPSDPPAPKAVPGPGRGLPRAVGIALATAGLLAVTATSAAVTVAVGRPTAHPAASAAGPAASATATGTTPTAAPAAGRSPGAAPSTSAAPTPTPSSTLHGTVNGDTHGGDLRYFLLPMPDGAEPYGSPDGTGLSVKDIAAQYSNAGEIPSVLDSYGYQDEGAYRRYRSADGRQEVETRLLRFKSRAMAQEFAQAETFKNGEGFGIDGDDSAKGYLMKPRQEAWTGRLVGVGYVGDVQYEITVFVKGTPDKSQLMDVMKRQRERLSDGG
ncbi:MULTISPECIES: hypothetical protein [Kitasatospora]|uniref:Serine/arginine repetitive matrix protein 2 n=1 Tax=Kitasatospora cystarginea TaxID=58350 RepID=A0ABP5R297_9ACTN